MLTAGQHCHCLRDAGTLPPCGKRPTSNCAAELQAAWATVGKHGHATGSDVIELHSEELGDQLQVELHDSRGLLAAGTLPVSTIWEVHLYKLVGRSRVNDSCRLHLHRGHAHSPVLRQRHLELGACLPVTPLRVSTAQDAEVQVQRPSAGAESRNKHSILSWLRHSTSPLATSEPSSHPRTGKGTRQSLQLYDAERHTETVGSVSITGWIGNSDIETADAVAVAAEVRAP